jgi:Transmembrane domain of unknown function (DUF3566)
MPSFGTMSRGGAEITADGRTQRSGGQPRLIGEGAEDGRVLTDMDRSSGDNLVTGDLPEEDDVDHRVEPPSWLPEGAARDQAANGDQSHAAGQQSAVADPAPADDKLPPLAGDVGAAADRDVMAPPYPAAVTTPPAGSGPATSSFSLLTSPVKLRRSPRPPKPPKAVKVSKVQARQAQNGVLPPRRAQLAVIRLEPWSVMKFSFMISLVGWVVLFVAVAGLYYVLSKLGVFHSIETSVSSVTSGKNSAGVKASHWFSASKVLGYTMLIGAVNVILITALATIGSVVYNLVTHVAGGIEVTLKETD